MKNAAARRVKYIFLMQICQSVGNRTLNPRALEKFIYERQKRIWIM